MRTNHQDGNRVAVIQNNHLLTDLLTKLDTRENVLEKIQDDFLGPMSARVVCSNILQFFSHSMRTVCLLFSKSIVNRCIVDKQYIGSWS